MLSESLDVKIESGRANKESASCALSGHEDDKMIPMKNHRLKPCMYAHVISVVPVRPLIFPIALQLPLFAHRLPLLNLPEQ